MRNAPRGLSSDWNTGAFACASALSVNGASTGKPGSELPAASYTFNSPAESATITSSRLSPSRSAIFSALSPPTSMNFGQPACSVGSWCRNSVLRSSPTLPGLAALHTRSRSVNANSFEGTFASPWIGGPTASGGAENWPSAATLVGNAAAAIAVAGIAASNAPGFVEPGP